MGLFLMSTPALGVVSKMEKKKPVTISAQKQKKTEKAAKIAKAEKPKRVTLDFDNKKSKPVAANKKAKANGKPKGKAVVAKLDKKKNYRSIYCQDGYVIKNHAYCLISSHKAKSSSKMVAKSLKKPVAVKAQRQVASKKDVTTVQRR